MKVLHVGPKNYPPNHGGVEKAVYDIVSGMPEVESHIFTEWQSPDSQPRVKKLPKNLFSAWKQVRQYATENGIDVIHLHKETFIPLAILLELSGFRCVITLHGCAWRLTRWPLRYRLLLWLIDCTACLLVSRVVFVSEHDRRAFERYFKWKKLYMIPYGVVVRECCRATERNGWVYLGRISPEKNILSLMWAAEAAQLHVTLYGPMDRHDKQFQKEFLNTIRKSSFVKWKGPVPSDKVQSVVAMYRVFINPSFSEGLPISVLEAAAEGLYLVLSDIPQHRLLKMPECSYIKPYALDLRGIKPSKNMALVNRKYVEREYSMTRMLGAYSTIYRSLV